MAENAKRVGARPWEPWLALVGPAAIGLGCVFLGVAPLPHRLAWVSGPARTLAASADAFGTLCLALPVLACVGWWVAGRVRRGRAPFSGHWPAALVVCWVVCCVTLVAQGWAIERERELIQLRGEPLIAALDAYHGAEGRYPISLDDLLEGYLDAIPSTGVAAYPRWHYSVPAEDGDWGPTTGAYALRAQCPWIPGFKHREAFYRPDGAYPAEWYSARVVREGAWAEFTH